jgi:hypothetical protein
MRQNSGIKMARDEIAATAAGEPRKKLTGLSKSASWPLETGLDQAELTFVSRENPLIGMHRDEPGNDAWRASRPAPVNAETKRCSNVEIAHIQRTCLACSSGGSGRPQDLCNRGCSWAG